MKSETIKASKKNKTTFMTLGLMTISNTECKNKTNHKRKKLISLDFIKIKNLYSSKDIVKKVNQQQIHREKICALAIFDTSISKGKQSN